MVAGVNVCLVSVFCVRGLFSGSLCKVYLPACHEVEGSHFSHHFVTKRREDKNVFCVVYCICDSVCLIVCISDGFGQFIKAVFMPGG